MNKKVRILGKKVIPVWLLVLALVAAAAGAASGTVLAGKVIGEVPVAVSQALLVGYPDNDATIADTVWIADTTFGVYTTELDNATQQVRLHKDLVDVPNRAFFGVKDDNTAFQAAGELATGDWTALNVPLKNASHNSLTGLLTLNVPDGLEVEVFANADDATNVTQVVRVGPNTWKFTLASTEESGADEFDLASFLTIVISADDDVAPGFYSIDGVIQQISF